MFPLDISYLRPNLGDDNRLYYRYLRYIGKVKAIEPANLILYHPMNEPSGGVADDKSAQGNDGAYTGVTLGQPGIGDGQTCPLFDGVNDFNNIYSAGLNADFNGQEVTVAAWAKVSGVGVWTDATVRRVFHLYVDVNNSIRIHRSTVNNAMGWGYTAGGTAKTADAGGHSETGWIHFAITVSKTGDAIKYYENGSQVGATVTGLGAWAGDLSATYTIIGANASTGANSWDGWLAHAPIWTKALTPAQILLLATV